MKHKGEYNMKFRNLFANEIDVRVGTVTYNTSKDKNSGIKGVTLLLYKDARVDMALLDEVVGSMNWQRTHEFKDGKLYCKIGIYDEMKKDWVWKEDVGTESNTEAEKGQASDSFKRCAVNWGIGRCLYTAPFIYVKPLPNEDLSYNKFYVKDIEYNEYNEIIKLVIVDKNGLVRYSMGENQKPTKTKLNPVLLKELDSLGVTLEMVASYLSKDVSELVDAELENIIRKTKERRNA